MMPWQAPQGEPSMRKEPSLAFCGDWIVLAFRPVGELCGAYTWPFVLRPRPPIYVKRDPEEERAKVLLS